MSIKLFFLLGCLLVSGEVRADENLNNAIREALEELRNDMATGVRGSGTILAPWTIHNDEFFFNVGEIMWWVLFHNLISI